MFALKKFLFCLELEVGAYAIAAYCSITSLVFLIFLSTLLYNANVVEVVKIAICVIFVSYYILTSIVVVQNVIMVSGGMGFGGCWNIVMFIWNVELVFILKMEF